MPSSPLINLHNHSAHSDGTLAPEALARTAARAGINFFSLTDHDMTAGWAEMEPALKEAGIIYCYGVEFSSSLHDSLHILGYGLDPANPALLAKAAIFRAKRLERLKTIIGLLRGLGLEISYEELPFGDSHTLGRPHIADLLKKKGFVKTRKEAFERYIGRGRPAYAPPNGPGIEEAIQTIKAAGGFAVLAHPGVVVKILDLPAWKDMGLDGIEAFYPSHSNTLTREFIALAARYGLFITAGIDFHGPGTDRDRMFGFEYSEEMFKGIKKAFI
ncbi:MAG: PHP domain-containing protein [Elusimicrobia bacterium]|nr:PHP domain-containing protein [Elusimicrobiota bacterium]